MGLKICLRPSFIPRKTSLVFKPRDIMLGIKILTGKATTADLMDKAGELAIDAVDHKAKPYAPETKTITKSIIQSSGITGQKGISMQTPTSWKKLTITLLTLAVVLLQIFVQPASMTPENAATMIAGLVIAGIIGLVYILTQGKIDIAKLTSSGTGSGIENFLEGKFAEILTPITQRIEDLGIKVAGNTGTTAVTQAPAPPQIVQNPDGTFKAIKADGTEVTI
ncbi:MAG TPA: hypothetical protein VHV83_07135 [Armatimonadota bacterium]|nr:hypothetical protein [Armatimonadota bacterium]